MQLRILYDSSVIDPTGHLTVIIEGRQADLMQHQVIDRSIRKASVPGVSHLHRLPADLRNNNDSNIPLCHFRTAGNTSA